MTPLTPHQQLNNTHSQLIALRDLAEDNTLDTDTLSEHLEQVRTSIRDIVNLPIGPRLNPVAWKLMSAVHLIERATDLPRIAPGVITPALMAYDIDEVAVVVEHAISIARRTGWGEAA